jgi:hypothetical protein
MFQVFQHVLQMLYIDVAKVDWDVAYIVMAIHVCFKYVLNVSSVLDVCCKCFILMLEK